MIDLMCINKNTVHTWALTAKPEIQRYLTHYRAGAPYSLALKHSRTSAAAAAAFAVKSSSFLMWCYGVVCKFVKCLVQSTSGADWVGGRARALLWYFISLLKFNMFGKKWVLFLEHRIPSFPRGWEFLRRLWAVGLRAWLAGLFVFRASFLINNWCFFLSLIGQHGVQ